MRIRRKPWAIPELESSSFYIKRPEEYKGKWNNVFKNNNPIHLELGCGRGIFASTYGINNPNINLIAIDLKSDILGVAKRNIEKIYNEKNRQIDNVILVAKNIEQILEIFNSNDNIEKIYINFCNPWPKIRHKKRRLTHPYQLKKYKEFLKKGAIIEFKTDDDNLFNESIDYFQNEGFKIIEKLYDLQSVNDETNIITEHEKMFIEQGVNIKKLIAEM